MKSLFDYGNDYARQSDWKDFSLLKLCLCAIGVMIGCGVPQKHKKTVMAVSGVVWILTCIPLVRKFLGIMRKR